ncbi:glycosyltransferase family 1 protein [Streptomyces sp. TRM66268-LWL]|uniref:Glycosyltransferase family 1 protein n=1 Tax=Streptomyces polyasparticus TaxID=2767826 RepID=A0ABR7SLT0_9ACTN|nr:glycosyltransferase family 1 protein [Streptomyces polyasparticus]MBC9716299.1 glycosyltransferase family 1 protein [Streptomyces polyasparticus]
MTEVLIIASSRPQFSVLADAISKFEALGARVHLAGTFHLSAVSEQMDGLGLDAAAVHQLPRGLGHRNQAIRRQAAKGPRGLQVWLQAQRDPWLRARARSADLLVALDQNAVYTVWRLAQRHPAAEARFGLAPALRALQKIQSQPDDGRTARRENTLPPLGVVGRDIRRGVTSVPSLLMRTATSRRVMRTTLGARLWRTASTAPGLPPAARAATARYVAEGMQLAGRNEGASLALRNAAAKISDLALRAELLDEAVAPALKRGKSPSDMDQSVAAHLAHADAAFAAGEITAAKDALGRALQLHFHRVIHIDQLSSPLTEDPESYVDPLYRSTAMQALSRPRGRKVPAADAPTDRPLRLLVTVSANDNFLHHIRDHFSNHPGVELRFLDLAASKPLSRISWAAARILEDRLSDGTSPYQEEVERLMRPHLDWADTVLLEWAVGPAAMLTTIDPGDTRVMVRLHSYEVFTRWPHMTDYSRVDDLVFVAPHVRDLATSLLPQLRGEQAPRIHVVNNTIDLPHFVRPKSAEARFNLGLVGIGQVPKDPLWAVRVLKLLREHDERYRLLLVGDDMDPSNSQAARAYRKDFEKEVAPLVEDGAVLRLGHTDDVASKLTDIGVILSASVRESFHIAVVEGAASGAVPVVRDWPYYAGKPNSARTIYPSEWVVSSPEEAVQRILRTTADETTWLNAGKLASDHAMTTWDWSVVRKGYEELFLGED